MKNPFKFGSIVDEPFFTNRHAEIQNLKMMLNSENHIILISPRRYGKTSLVSKVIKETKRSCVSLDLQLITGVEDFASQLLKRVFKAYPFEKLKLMVRQFRIIPTISLNPVNNEIDIAFQPHNASFPILEDVLNLIESLGSKTEKPIVIFDEFQEVHRIGQGLDRQLRAIMQQHQCINYILLGSIESMMQAIFEKKKSSFYHFGMLLPLGKIPYDDFKAYLKQGFNGLNIEEDLLSDEILKFTDCHPYYTQQLAYKVWEIAVSEKDSPSIILQAINQLVEIHDMDYERLWQTIKQTDKKIMIGLSTDDRSLLSDVFSRKYAITATSTTFSSIKRLQEIGYILKNGKTYEIDDPFFKQWIKQRRDR